MEDNREQERVERSMSVPRWRIEMVRNRCKRARRRWTAVCAACVLLVAVSACRIGIGTSIPYAWSVVLSLSSGLCTASCVMVGRNGIGEGLVAATILAADREIEVEKFSMKKEEDEHGT